MNVPWYFVNDFKLRFSGLVRDFQNQTLLTSDQGRGERGSFAELTTMTKRIIRPAEAQARLGIGHTQFWELIKKRKTVEAGKARP